MRHLGVEFGRYQPATGRAGAFDFHAPARLAAHTDKVFLEYGGLLTWGACPPECGVVGSFLYRLPPDARVLSPIDGYVLDFGHSANWNDTSIVLGASRARGFWFIVVDHVLNVRVQRGQRVAAGDWIAGPGNGVLEIDLTTQDNRTHCMLRYFDTATVDVWRQRVADLMRDWEEYRGNSALYAEGAMVEPGCVVEEVVR